MFADSRMNVAYTSSFIDSVFEREDATALHVIISVRARTSPLPDECALFARVLEWLGSDWQYYGAIGEDDFIEVCRLLKKFGMSDVLAKYQEGKSSASVDLSPWFLREESAIRESLFRHAHRSIEFLKKNEG